MGFHYTPDDARTIISLLERHCPRLMKLGIEATHSRENKLIPVELKQRVAELSADKERLDWLDNNCTRISDSERYLPKSVYWGGGTHRDVRQAIDAAMKLGAHHPMGPLELADFIGLDTCLSIMQVLHEGLADSKYRPCPLLVKYVEAGWLGRKTQRGFYDYRGDKPVPTR